MTSERWSKTKRILEAALDLPPQMRTEFLTEACQGDDQLREEIESLLNVSREKLSIFEKSPVDAIGQSAEPSLEGQKLGPYKLIRILGRGGMGVVYLADRIDGVYDGQVAVKILKRGMDTDEIVRRFRNERQILSRLSHPNIAQLIDGGSSEAGLPYFVMAYIKGEPIDRYCARHSSSVAERLILFRKACAAVQFLHQNLVVHRDLKPSNVFVSADGEPQLLDFGIAKLLDRTSLQPVSVTSIGRQLMTPEYASPEQVQGEPINTATDVYSLGVLLYELLTGQRPYVLKRHTEEEIRRVICGKEPRNPSAVVNTGKHRRRLSGDLDSITLKALRKRPQDRYSSAERLAEDILRHLEAEPVEARRGTFAYRAGRFFRRHRLGVVIASAFAILFSVFLTLLTVQYRETARQRDVARQEAERANRQAEAARQTSDFLIDVFEVSDPGEAQGRNITASEILANGAQRIEAELSDQPLTQARLMNAIGVVYQNLGLFDEAAQQLEGALARRRAAFGGDPLEVAESLNNLAVLRDLQGDYEAAEPLYRETLGIHREILGDQHPDVGMVLNNLAAILWGTGDFDGAEPLLREALAISREHHGDKHPDVVTHLNNLAVLLDYKGDHGAAEAMLREALAMNRVLLGNVHPDIATNLNNLAQALKKKGDYETAEQMLQEALDMNRELLGERHPSVATNLNNLADLLTIMGRYERAEAVARKSIRILTEKFSENHWRTAVARSILGASLTGLERYSEAEPLLVNSFEVIKAAKGPEAKNTRDALSRIVALYDAWGKPTRARKLF